MLQSVRDPESGVPIADLRLVRLVRIVEPEQLIYLEVAFDDHAPNCVACAGIAMTLLIGIRRELSATFEDEFPGYQMEFI